MDGGRAVPLQDRVHAEAVRRFHDGAARLGLARVSRIAEVEMRACSFYVFHMNLEVERGRIEYGAEIVRIHQRRSAGD